MAIETYSGIIFRTLPYSETSYILDIFSRRGGLKSFIVSGVRKKKSKIGASLYKPMNLINFVAYVTEQDKLYRIKEAKYDIIYQRINSEVIRSSMGMFMIDLCRNSIKEKESNEALYDYLKESFIRLDSSEESVNDLHLKFTIGLTAFLGFFPQANWSEQNQYFDLVNGMFVSDPTGLKYYVDSTESSYLFDLMQNQNQRIAYSRDSRTKLLDYLVVYYKLHIEGFNALPSLEVCRTIFS